MKRSIMANQEYFKKASITNPKIDISKFDCDICGVVECEQYNLGNGVLPPYCKTCKNEKIKIEEQQIEARRKKANEVDKIRKKQERIKRNFQVCNVPPRYQGYDFSNFITSNEEQERNLKLCQKYVDSFSENLKLGRCLIALGKVGAGKTHLTCSIINELTKKDYKCLFTTFSKAVRKVRECYTNRDKTIDEVMESFADFDLIVFDEVGVQVGSENELFIFTEIMNERYEKCLPSIVISNKTKKEFEACLGSRVYDRLFENQAEYLAFNNNSYRRKESS